ncbi:MAG: hypothetical protein ABI602_01650 [Candidatus Saccharibacteria bacterium]
MSKLKPSPADVAFPRQREELLKLAFEDQLQAKGHSVGGLDLGSQQFKSVQITNDYHIRAHKMLEILDIVKAPTITNIGMDGSKAVSLLALHSYLDLMKRVLVVFEQQFARDPAGIYFQAIPPLTDRITILESKSQSFGTNWTIDQDGKPFLITVKNFSDMNKRRAKYGLKPSHRPVNLAVGAAKYPLGKGFAKETDQKDLTDEEYAEYSRDYLKSKL